MAKKSKINIQDVDTLKYIILWRIDFRDQKKKKKQKFIQKLRLRFIY